jgi:hypothetical protein
MTRSYRGLLGPGKIDSRMKLQLVLLFCRHRGLCEGAVKISEWLREIPWAVEDALAALAECGVLASEDGPGGRRYRLGGGAELRALLLDLVWRYDDPLERDELYQLVRSASQEREYHACLALFGPRHARG